MASIPMQLTEFALGASFLGNIALVAYLIRTGKKPVKRLDVTANDLLHDLTGRGSAVLRVEVLDAEALLYMRRP